MMTHEVRTQLHVGAETKIEAEFLATLVTFWFSTFPKPEQRFAIPRSRAEWAVRVGLLMERDGLGEKAETARSLHETLSKCGDFEIAFTDDDEILIEFVTKLNLILYAEPVAEEDQPSVH